CGVHAFCMKPGERRRPLHEAVPRTQAIRMSADAPRERGSVACLTEPWRRVREDVRVKEEWPNPDWSERCGCIEPDIKVRSTDDWRLTCVLIVACRNQRYRADVVTGIRVIVNGCM